MRATFGTVTSTPRGALSLISPPSSRPGLCPGLQYLPHVRRPVAAQRLLDRLTYGLAFLGGDPLARAVRVVEGEALHARVAQDRVGAPRQRHEQAGDRCGREFPDRGLPVGPLLRPARAVLGEPSR